MIISQKSDFPSMIHNPEGEVLQEILGLQAGGAHSHSIARVTIPPGKSALPHFHKQSEESYLILNGLATMKIDQKDFQLNPGDAVLIEPNEIHQISNTTDQNLVFLAVCVPAWDPDDSFEAR